MIGKPTILTPEQIQYIVWCYEFGTSKFVISKMSREMKCSLGKIRQVLADHDLVSYQKPEMKKKKQELLKDDPVEGKVCTGKSYAEYLKEKGVKVDRRPFDNKEFNQKADKLLARLGD